MVFVVSHVSGHRRTWCISDKLQNGEDILEALKRREGCGGGDVVLQCEGRVITPSTAIGDEALVVATLRLPGGKGGFGSMLRAIGAQIEKTTNREACRDLSGRRLRDINEEKRLKDFINKKAERERELQEKKRQKFKMLEENPRHTFQDETYFQQRELREKNLYDSLDKAFGAQDNGASCSSSSSGNKKCKKEEPLTKKKKFLDDLDESSSDDDEGAEAKAQEGTDSENSAGGSDSSNGRCEETTATQVKDQEAPSLSKDSDKSEDKRGSTPTKRKCSEDPPTRKKKGRFFDDLDESSSEDEETNGEETKTTSQDTTESSSSSSKNDVSADENTTKKEEDVTVEGTCTQKDEASKD